MNARGLAAAGIALALACAAAPAAAQAGGASANASANANATMRAGAIADAAFKSWDRDHNGVLSQAEFRAGMQVLLRRTQANAELAVRLREQFDKVDANGNDGIDAGEYGNLLLVREAGKGAPALAAFDRNHDQRLEFTEYLELVGRLAAEQKRAGGKAP